MKNFVLMVTMAVFLALMSCTATMRPIHHHHHGKAVVIKKLPKQHTVVYVRGGKYFKHKNTYYVKVRGGYKVVRL